MLLFLNCKCSSLVFVWWNHLWFVPVGCFSEYVVQSCWYLLYRQHIRASGCVCVRSPVYWFGTNGICSVKFSWIYTLNVEYFIFRFPLFPFCWYSSIKNTLEKYDYLKLKYSGRSRFLSLELINASIDGFHSIEFLFRWFFFSFTALFTNVYFNGERNLRTFFHTNWWRILMKILRTFWNRHYLFKQIPIESYSSFNSVLFLCVIFV